MNLKNIRNAKGTGTGTTDNKKPYSSTPFFDYLWLMFKTLIWFFLFCFTTTNNYMNTQSFNPNVDYPMGDILKTIIKNNAKQNVNPVSPYCSSLADCSANPLNKPNNVSRASIWFQNTQESCYHLGGWFLHKYFSSLKWGIGSSNEIPFTGIFSISFIRWFLFGVCTQFSMILMLCLVWVIFIPGWFGGLLAFMKTNDNDVYKTWSFFISVLLTIFGGWVSIGPVIYEFFYLIYLFFFKQLTTNSAELAPEFTKRMSNLIIVFVIVAIIVAAIQLPPITAGVIGVIVILVHFFVKNKSLYANKTAAPAN